MVISLHLSSRDRARNINRGLRHCDTDSDFIKYVSTYDWTSIKEKKTADLAILLHSARVLKFLMETTASNFNALR